MIVALDGPAGAGKSTIAKKVAEKTGMFYLNSGNFYRAITYSVLKHNIDPKNEKAVIAIAEKARLEIRNGRVHLNGRDVEDELHTDRIDDWVSEHSAIVAVRHIVNRNLHTVSADLDVVVEGRDISTVVFPNAEVKIYLDASQEIRAKRRYEQGTSTLPINKILDNIKKRDMIDSGKVFGSLKIAPGALYLDTSDLTIDEVCDKVINKINYRGQ